MEWYRVNLEGSFYFDMVGKVVHEEPCTLTLDFGIAIGKATFRKEYLTLENMGN